ncbi:MAG TPA: hypothetical protein PKI46_02875 [Bacteroidales bacterium]|nr:hypothetical protein [Bacteroidales bacterium]
MAYKWQKLFQYAIQKNVPIRFLYWSNRSPFFIGAERPDHYRVVQPVVLGIKQFKSGKKAAYFRGYLLGEYSYSRNKNFNSEITNKARNPRYWRLYNVSKMRYVETVPEYPKEKRFYPTKHKEYNPNDKFFTQIIYAMEPVKEYSYYFTGMEENTNSNRWIIEKIEKMLKDNKIIYNKPIRYYKISENEEVGFLDSNNVWINTIWAEQVKDKFLIKGLKSLKQ